MEAAAAERIIVERKAFRVIIIGNAGYVYIFAGICSGIFNKKREATPRPLMSIKAVRFSAGRLLKASTLNIIPLSSYMSKVPLSLPDK